MTHAAPATHLTTDPARDDPTARRIADLSREYLDGPAEDRGAKAEEIAGLIRGRVVPIR